MLPLVPSGQVQRDPMGRGLSVVQVPDLVAHFLLYVAAMIRSAVLLGASPPGATDVPAVIAESAGGALSSNVPAFTCPRKNRKASPATNLEFKRMGLPL